MIRCIVLSVFVVCLSFVNLASQTNIGFYYNHTLPFGEFADNADDQIGGFMVTTLFRPTKNNRLAVGGELGVSMYANDDFEYFISEGDQQGRYVQVNQDDCFFQYGATARYHLTDLAEQKVINPYFESRLGGVSFFSTLAEGEECEVDYHSETELHGTSFYAGAGAGILFHINNYWEIDLNVIYNNSSRAVYRHIPDPEDVNYRLELTDHMYKSRTDHLSIRLGMLMGF